MPSCSPTTIDYNFIIDSVSNAGKAIEGADYEDLAFQSQCSRVVLPSYSATDGIPLGSSAQQIQETKMIIAIGILLTNIILTN